MVAGDGSIVAAVAGDGSAAPYRQIRCPRAPVAAGRGGEDRSRGPRRRRHPHASPPPVPDARGGREGSRGEGRGGAASRAICRRRLRPRCSCCRLHRPPPAPERERSRERAERPIERSETETSVPEDPDLGARGWEKNEIFKVGRRETIFPCGYLNRSARENRSIFACGPNYHLHAILMGFCLGKSLV